MTSTSPEAPTTLAAIETAVAAFTAAEPGRAVAMRALRGPALDIAINADTPMPAASLVKVPLAMTVYDLANAGHINLGQRVTSDSLGSTAYPSILAVFDPAHRFSLAELVRLMLATSDNPAACYLVELVGAEAINHTLTRLGARATQFEVSFSDDVLGQAGRATTTTATDQVTILTALTAEPRYQPLITAMRNSMRNFRIPLRLPDELHVAHKTGSLASVANDAGVILGPNVDLALAFLTDGQADTAATSVAIGDCAARVWDLLNDEDTGVSLP